MKTIIENRWTKTINGKKETCTAFWIYEDAAKGKPPMVRISGYNPFPFFAKTREGLPSSLSVFNAWMEENGWTKKMIVTDIYSKIAKD